MHILLYSRPFFPATGGLETVSLTLAESITGAGHSCTVVTETADAPEQSRFFSFAVERRPNARRRLALARSADLVHSNGASLALFPFAKLARKPFIWTHQGYQLVAVDGLGWFQNRPAPMTPAASVWFHARKRGLKVGLVEAAKLAVRRTVSRLVDRNVAISNWVAERQPLPRQIVIYNPFPLDRFRAPAPARPGSDRDRDFVYVGRLVSEKGVATLLRALATLNGRPGRRQATMLVIGDGEYRATAEQLVSSLGLSGQVEFAGTKRDRPLIEAIHRGRIAVVPSEWEEAMGGVALELLAAGLPLIVSERGGLAECVADAAWTFPNGDHRVLAEQMGALLDDETLRRSKSERAREVVARFDESRLVGRYLDLYGDVLGRRRR